MKLKLPSSKSPLFHTHNILSYKEYSIAGVLHLLPVIVSGLVQVSIRQGDFLPNTNIMYHLPNRHQERERVAYVYICTVGPSNKDSLNKINGTGLLSQMSCLCKIQPLNRALPRVSEVPLYIHAQER